MRSRAGAGYALPMATDDKPRKRYSKPKGGKGPRRFATVTKSSIKKSPSYHKGDDIKSGA